ncbi:MAG TPA: alpha/beta fold hydrolase [Anaerolineales bacterium]|nr:alpha/beta fold hydrolase [Anaerolineales bacterium]
MQNTDDFSIQHSIDNGIERITYFPRLRRFKTPILLQHGMWHAAWCWQPWQELFAAWGWETHAFSLPGHGASPVQRPTRWATLGYYFEFLMAEIERLPHRPVLMGHSMGGALTQWYLKYANDPSTRGAKQPQSGQVLPAAVLVAPWTSHTMLPSVFRSVPRDPWGTLLCGLTLTSTPAVRSPARAAEMFIHPGALYSPEELHARLGPESFLVLWQYNPLLWSPTQRTSIPLLWLAGAEDVLIAEPESRRSAAHYRADYTVVPDAGHNLMMEKSYQETAQTIHKWLIQRGIS